MKGKVVLITGGSNGIGLETAVDLAKRGAQLIIGCRKVQGVDGKIQQEAPGAVVDVIKLDLSSNSSIRDFAEKVLAKYDSIDVLINNAGGAPMVDSLTASPKFHEAIIDLNLTAPLNLSQKIAKKMIKQKTVSNIINISSVTATRPTPGSAAYGAAKGALVNLTKTLAVEWAPKIKVNSIIVGYIETENSILHYGSKSEIKKVAKTIPLKRMGQPQDIANACVFFASDMAEWVTGSALEVHGGGESPAYLDVAKPK